MKHKVLVVDDDLTIRTILEKVLKSEGHTVVTALTGEEGVEKAEQENPDLVLLDIGLPGIDGIETLGRIVKLDPDIAVIMITAQGSVETAVAAMKAGAFDYVTKPVDLDKLELVLARALELRAIKLELAQLREAVRSGGRDSGLIGESAAMRALRDLIDRVAASDATVLITGESGTGKELVARAIHQGGARAKGPFVALNCAAVPEALMESELFGHVRGAFTDARAQRQGIFESADGGTVFLDEIGDISPKQQAFLLRILETGEYERVGDSKTLRVDVRVIAATNRSLEQKVSEGTFREDLYYRLNVMNILAPPLRDRKEDIPLLSDHFRKHFNQQLNRKVERFSKEARRLLTNYKWPGNVRELRNTIERALLLCRETKLQKHHLPQEFSTSNDVGYTHKPKQIKKEITPDTKPVLDADTVNSALVASYWNVTQAAKSLNISRVHLHRLIKKYKLTRD